MTLGLTPVERYGRIYLQRMQLEPQIIRHIKGILDEVEGGFRVAGNDSSGFPLYTNGLWVGSPHGHIEGDLSMYEGPVSEAFQALETSYYSFNAYAKITIGNTLGSPKAIFVLRTTSGEDIAAYPEFSVSPATVYEFTFSVAHHLVTSGTALRLLIIRTTSFSNGFNYRYEADTFLEMNQLSN